MVHYRILKFVIIIFAWSVGGMFAFIISLFKKFENDNGLKQYSKWVSYILLPISLIMLILLLLNKNFFHWNFDIATGEPVDHYSTYYSCLIYISISTLLNSINIIAKNCLDEETEYEHNLFLYKF